MQTPLNRTHRITFRCIAVALGFIHIWSHRHYMNPDGISYLEMAAAGMKVGWRGFLNGYWSPLYLFLLSVVFRVFHPAPYWESTAVHLTDFVIYLGALASFEVFLKQLIRRQDTLNVRWSDAIPASPQTVWTWAGYISFLWVFQYWQNITLVTPDLLVAALVLLASALLLRIRDGRGCWATFAGLGVILGFGYLAKAAMFPLAFVFLACSFFAANSYCRALPRVALALVSFLFVASPLLIGLSQIKHRLTFGDSGGINYAFYVDGIDPSGLWQGGPPFAGAPVHPVRKLMSAPAVYEFAAPIAATYPPWFDPSYWYEGVAPHFEWKGQLVATLRALGIYLSMVFQAGMFFVVLIALGFVLWRSRGWSDTAKNDWMVWFPSVAAMGMYALVHTEFRFVGGFALVLWMCFFVGLRLSQPPDAKLLQCIALTMILAPAISLLWTARKQVSGIIANEPSDQRLVAEKLQSMGIAPGTEVGVIGGGPYVYWAHLAGVRIVAEIPGGADQNIFWAADSETQARAMEKFAEAGARAIVAASSPASNSTLGWEHIPGTIYSVRKIGSSGI